MFLIENRNIKDEKEAALLYFGNIKKQKYFNTLKNELKKELVQYIVANSSWSGRKEKAVIEDCYRSFAAYKILLANGKRKAAIELAGALLLKLQKIEIYALAYIITRDIRAHYASSEPNLQMVKKYDEEIASQMAILQAETLVHQYYDRVAFICNTRDGFSKEHLSFFAEAVEKTAPFLQLGVHTLNRFIYNMIISRYTAERDYENALTYCEEALASVPTDHPNIRSFRFSFLHRKTSVLLGLGKTEEAKDISRQASEIFPEGTINWHIALIKRVMVCLHGGDSQEAYELYKASKKCPCSQPHLGEYWNIIEGYLYFLIKRGLIEPYSNERFFLGKFLNDMPIFEKDKAGQNINILLIQILVQMQQKQYGSIIDRIDSLKQYIRSYTRSPTTKRANIFIKMIVVMEKAQFHRTRTETRTQELLKQLRDTPIRFGQSLAVEIIPYPMLWDEILDILEDKFRRTTIPKTSEAPNKS